MSKVWVIGAGQLGALLKQAGKKLNIDVEPLRLTTENVPSIASEDIITAELEHWPKTEVVKQLSTHPNFVCLKAFQVLADRLPQKQRLDQLKLNTSPWRPVNEETTAKELFDLIGDKIILKRRTGGYDGKGQHWLKKGTNEQIPSDWHNQAIAEQGIDFEEEVSLIGVRNKQGQCIFYPLTLNLHIDGILYASISPLARLKPLQKQAEQMLTKIMDSLDYQGTMAMECFRLGDQLVINELAPRVHNSGHWTLTGADASQFENHLRAIKGLPIKTPTVSNINVMINLIGTEFDKRWSANSHIDSYWYNKQVRPGRKVGHLNVSVADLNLLREAIKSIENQLPKQYRKVLSWLYEQISTASHVLAQHA